jgi:hypothetical protein
MGERRYSSTVALYDINPIDGPSAKLAYDIEGVVQIEEDETSIELVVQEAGSNPIYIPLSIHDLNALVTLFNTMRVEAYNCQGELGKEKI